MQQAQTGSAAPQVSQRLCRVASAQLHLAQGLVSHGEQQNERSPDQLFQRKYLLHDARLGEVDEFSDTREAYCLCGSDEGAPVAELEHAQSSPCASRQEAMPKWRTPPDPRHRLRAPFLYCAGQ